MHIISVSILLFILELLRFYGSSHKDYADCEGTSVAHYDCTFYGISFLFHTVNLFVSSIP